MHKGGSERRCFCPSELTRRCAARDDGAAAVTVRTRIDAKDLLRLTVPIGERKSHHHELHAWLTAQRPGWRSEQPCN